MPPDPDPAAAHPVTSEGRDGVVVSSVSQENPAEVARYWTPQRIAAARPVMPTVAFPDDDTLRPTREPGPTPGLPESMSCPAEPLDPVERRGADLAAGGAPGSAVASARATLTGVSIPPIRLRSTVLGAPDPDALARFYERLLGWARVQDEPDWVKIQGPDGQALAFQLEPDHEPPVWPPRPGTQQMMAHLDFTVDDLTAASAHARTVGAVLSDHQVDADVLVHLDPAGHLFCLFVPDHT